jgi:hypothetical protein
MLKKTIGIIRLDLLNTAIAIAEVWVTIRIFYLMFFEREAIFNQIPNHSNFSMVVIITYSILRFAAVVYKNSRLNNHKSFSFVNGNIFFGIAYMVWLLVVYAAEAGGGTKVLLPLIMLIIGIPSLLISFIVNSSILYKVALSWIRPLRRL